LLRQMSRALHYSKGRLTMLMDMTIWGILAGLVGFAVTRPLGVDQPSVYGYVVQAVSSEPSVPPVVERCFTEIRKTLTNARVDEFRAGVTGSTMAEIRAAMNKSPIYRAPATTAEIAIAQQACCEPNGYGADQCAEAIRDQRERWNEQDRATHGVM